MGHMKGIAFVDTVRFLRAHRDEALAALAPELRHYLDEFIVASQWYPACDMSGLLRCAANLYPGSPDRALEIMGETTVIGHADVYGELVARGSSSRTIVVWSRQYDTGALTRIRETPNSVRFELIDFADTSRELCLVVGGYLKGSLAIAGLSDPSVTKLECRLWGDRVCAWLATWSPRDPDILSEPSDSGVTLAATGTKPSDGT
jgi:hypothetical protein